MKIGILGSGAVAKALAIGFIARGDEVMLGTRQPGKLAEWTSGRAGAAAGTLADAAQFGEVVVLATKGTAAAEVLRSAGASHFAEKTILDTTNPITDAPPVNGVLSYFTGPNDSLMERLQQEFPSARFVKCFNSVGNAVMVHPNFDGVRPTMFICGNDEASKSTAARILDTFGWETADMGAVEAARAIEPLAILWCIPGFLRGEWGHAFKVLRPIDS
jgi:predicted dinucleotide-binding enzyme